MAFTRSRLVAAGASVLAASIVLAGCTPTAEPVEDGPVTIVVGDMPNSSQEAGRALYLQKVEDFQKANPDITLETSETIYDTQTFTAQLAGGTLPTVMTAPFTEIQGLANRGQVRNLASYYDEDPVLQGLAPSVVDLITAKDGAEYGVPTSAFTLSLMINRQVFEDAGLDPETTPLDTWEDVAKAAATISAKTDAAGLAQLSTENQGGWILTAMTNAFGGQIQTMDDAGVATATVDNDATKEALEWLHDLRWNDDAVGSNFLMQFTDAGAALAAGQYGMLIGASQWYNQLVTTYGMDPQDFGLFPIPQTKDGLGSLGGGSVAIIRADATDAETAAAIKWTEFFYLDRYTDLEFAAEDAAATIANGGVVPRVGLALVDEDVYAKYLEAIADSVNVPLENLTAYTTASQSEGFAVTTEPKVEAQQIYGLLDSVIQAVLTDKNADIDALLAAAQTNAESILASAQ
jgi:multiple sugar transport system substrate-binding protein